MSLSEAAKRGLIFGFTFCPFVQASRFQTRCNHLQKSGAKAWPPEETIGSELDGSTVSFQEQGCSAYEVDRFLFACDLMFQQEGAHDSGYRFLFVVHIVHLEIDIGDLVEAPSAQNA